MKTFGKRVAHHKANKELAEIFAFLAAKTEAAKAAERVRRAHIVRTAAAMVAVSPVPHVYFIQDTVSGAIKIGKANDPTTRLRSLQTAHAHPLAMLAATSRVQERQCHAQFAGDHIRGEWFRPSTALLTFIRDIS